MKVDSHLFGWQHFQFLIPQNWDLVAEHGHEIKGYIRLADLDMIRVEMKWQKIPKKAKLLDVVADHVKKIGWENHKIIKLNNTDNAYSVENRSKEINQQVLFLKSNHPKTRLAVIRIFYKFNENGSKLVKDLVNSFQDNFYAPQSLWTYYDCHLVVPSVYKKVQSNINAGNKEIILAYKHKTFYSWSISLASHFCPHKPFNTQTCNLWIYELLKNKFNKEISLKKEGYLENIQTHAKTTVLGCMLLKNIFHLSHHWEILAKYHPQTDILKIVIFNYKNANDLARFQNRLELIN